MRYRAKKGLWRRLYNNDIIVTFSNFSNVTSRIKTTRSMHIHDMLISQRLEVIYYNAAAIDRGCKILISSDDISPKQSSRLVEEEPVRQKASIMSYNILLLPSSRLLST